MKKFIVILFVLISFAVILAGLGVVLNNRYHFLHSSSTQSRGESYYCPMHPEVTSNQPGDCPICNMSLIKKEQAKADYYCPMHPDVRSDKPGTCPICNMDLVKSESAAQSPAMAHKPGAEQNQSGSKRIKYYRNPHNPEITSPVPAKDEMGMDFIPVYEEDTTAANGSFLIGPEKQQLIGIKKGKVEKREMTGEIMTVGRVAYDPNLFIAQEEFLQAIKSRRIMQKTSLPADQADSFIKIARRRLLLMGMSEPEIAEMVKSGKPQQTLYLPTPEEKSVWVYLTVYQNETSFVSPGQDIEVETTAYPGTIFKGKIVSIGPILNDQTRSLKVRARVEDSDNRLKLEMYVNARIMYTLGEKLAIPQEAVMPTGVENRVYIVDANDHFERRNVVLGAKAGGYYEVIKGLEPNQTVVTSGNFLVDSEARLKQI